MAGFRRFIRALLMTVILLAVVVPAVTYVVLSTPWAQNYIREIAEKELAQLLGTQVEIGRIDYKPFNTIAVSSIAVRDHSGRKALGIGRVSARFELGYFLRSKRLVFDYAVLDAPEINVWRVSPGAPLNIEPILERFKKKDNQQPPATFDLKIGTIILRDGIATYNVESEPVTPGRFNANHVYLEKLNLHAYLRHASNDDLDAMIETMSFCEKSGFELTDLVVDLTVGSGGVALRDFEVELPSSRIAFQPFRLEADGFPGIADAIRKDGVVIATAEPAAIATADLGAFAPILSTLDVNVRTDFEVFVSDRLIQLKSLRMSTPEGLAAELSGSLTGLENDEKKSASLDIHKIEASGAAIGTVVERVNHKAAEFLRRINSLFLKGTARMDGDTAEAGLEIGVNSGKIDIKATSRLADGFKDMKFEGGVSLVDIPAGLISGEQKLGNVSASFDGSGSVSHGKIAADGEMHIISAIWNDHNFSDISIEGAYDSAQADIKVASNDPAAKFTFDGHFVENKPGTVPSPKTRSLSFRMDIESFKPEGLNLPLDREGFAMSGDISAFLSGSTLNDVEGYVAFSDMVFRDAESAPLRIKKFKAEMGRQPESDVLAIESDFLNGSIEGEINPTGLPLIFKDMAAHIVPSLFDSDEDIHEHLASQSLNNNFVADLTIENVADICRFLHLPVTIIYPVDILASVNSAGGSAGFSIDVPYLQQGDKIIDSTVIGGFVDTSADRAGVYASTHMPTKKGPMTVVLGITGADSRFDTRIDWEIERAIPLNGLIDFSTLLGRSASGAVCVDTRFNPGQINFGDDVWNIHPASISWCDNSVAVDNFHLTAGNQEILIDGHGSALPDDIVDIELKDITLISIFETLEIENAMIGGKANGTFKASQILSKIPVLTTDDLHVDSISYNRCVIGTADVTAKWDNEKQSFYLSADIVNPEGLVSKIYGDIFPAGERLDLNFNANHVRVGFMQPFMAAFASDVSGYGSGTAHLFGTFKDIDMEGDIFAEDLKLRIDFTNTVYEATDSVHITPGVIELNDITIKDVNGHTALLNGVLTHEYFHLPKFNFRLTDAHDFLCYNITEAMNPDWYGTIYGNGSASVVGHPGVIEIGADMSTAPGSVFTFVLSDRLEAEQYSFITFNDVTELTLEERLAANDTPEEVKEYQERMKAGNNDKPSDYNLDFKVDITPDAQMILVMDPVGGDRIRAYGSGDMRLTYNSTENDIRMYGTYTLDRGNYNFTLQDIIIKDFTIDAGSSITFRGDPYSAQLNIEAAYQLNANLSDLDESFTMDKDLNRTNVPVQALLKVSGDMRQPDLDFDLRFPTLTSDTYRKVRSIISTDDMMNRQIIYLLALNRFYTPDYMESTTKGNELFSVASSTIASQLSNILGKLSDKWSIAPNLRSDRGDFSDVEVDVALSSRLLNNRLLLNGNLGYRDKSLNTNQFIGDFDLEYLLTPTGNWRLKGYSRYNDQNYYVRSAATTQGVGIMFRRDFDSLFPRRRPKSEPSDSVVPDTVAGPDAIVK